MPESLILIICSGAVVGGIALIKKYAVPIENLGALTVTIILCGIAAGIETLITTHSSIGLAGAFLAIYAISNLIFQLITRASR